MLKHHCNCLFSTVPDKTYGHARDFVKLLIVIKDSSDYYIKQQTNLT